MNYFTYAGTSSRTYGILIDSHTGYHAPERDYDTVEVPGRNGTLTVDNGRYQNVDLTYHCGIGVGFHAKYNQFRAWLMSYTGYRRLEDTYHTDQYRMARVKSAPSPEYFVRGRAGTFDVTFDCKPQRFLKSGETQQTFSSGGSITNPTLYPALPLVRVYGTGTLTIGSVTIVINSASSYTDLDSEIQDAYCGAINCNGNITLRSGSFFELQPGSNAVSMSSGITQVRITPRWWTL